MSSNSAENPPKTASATPYPIEEDQTPLTIDDSPVIGKESGYGSSITSETTTLSSSIYDYVYENGRRYHRFQEGKYVLPNDETEQDRLDIYHHISLLLLKGRLHLAPLVNPQRVLDIGTGTGVWAVDMADTYPEAEVIGTDLSPIQPVWVPPNCKFEVDDAEQDWMFPQNHFDFIHSRTIAQSIREWPKYLKQIYKHTKPGGYVELCELMAAIYSDDGSLTPDSALSKWMNLFNEASRAAGLREFRDDGPEILSRELEEAGFVDISAHRMKQPWGSWPKDPHMKQVGQCMAAQSESALLAYSLALLTRYLHMSAEEGAKICDDALKEILGKEVHAYNYVVRIVARKPDRHSNESDEL